MKKDITKRIELSSMLLPFSLVGILCVLFTIFPTSSTEILAKIRFFFGDTLGSFYLLMGAFTLLTSLYIAFSKYGNIVLGETNRPEYSSFSWGSMMFTAGLAADILFYSLCEWILYANESYLSKFGSVQDFAPVFPLFHWGPIPWSFYMCLATAFGFMLHVRQKTKQKFSESLRPLFGKYVDGIFGKCIDQTAIFALLAGTATTFSLATPLLSYAIGEVTGLHQSVAFTIIILLVICLIYTLCAYLGIKGVSKLANLCSYIFFTLLIYVFLLGGEFKYIFETGISSVGNLANEFIRLSTSTDPLRESSFPQNWTIFYWAYWMVWCVATPFFIGSISKGRTIRQVILGGYSYGISGTFLSFIILGNYGLAKQMKGGLNAIGLYQASGDLYSAIIAVIKTLPMPQIVLILLALAMIAFYATTFDSLTLVACSYSYKRLESHEEPDKRVKLFWSILLILLPIALLFSHNSMSNLQTVSIIAAFPLGIILFLIILSFFKDASAYLKGE